MRKFIALISFVLSIFIGTSIIAPGEAQAESYMNIFIDNTNQVLRTTDIYLDDVYVNAEVPAFTYQSRSLIPLRELGEAMGATIDWDAPNMTATMTLGGKSISMKIDSNVAVVNGVNKTITYGMPAKLANQKTMIPVRFIAEEFDCDVQWDAPNYRVNIYKGTEVSVVDPPEQPEVPAPTPEPAPVPDVTPTPPANNGLTVVVDAGHGGYDPGAISASRSYNEKTIALNVSKKLEAILKERGYNVVMTRTDDYFVGLSERAQISNNNNANIFVSIHFNAAGASSATGLETFYFPGSGEGGRLASNIQNQLVSTVGGVNRGVKTAQFTVISETVCEAVLAELGFITNPNDEARLGSDQYHQDSAVAIANGIDAYFGR